MTYYGQVKKDHTYAYYNKFKLKSKVILSIWINRDDSIYKKKDSETIKEMHTGVIALFSVIVQKFFD